MKRKRRIQWYYSVIFLAFGLTACQVKRPDTVISDAKMENVLYDFHIAKAMGEEVPYSESYKRVLYIESVYRKHGITQADFDTSMVWYARHPDALTKVYEKVNQRLKAERDGINHLIALRDNKPKESSPGDSIDVWRGRHICYLTGTPMDNKLTFTLPSDTNFKDRDTLRWTVRFRFLNGTTRQSARTFNGNAGSLCQRYAERYAQGKAIGHGDYFFICRHIGRNKRNTRLYLLSCTAIHTGCVGRPHQPDALPRKGYLVQGPGR